jgi:Holliday junction resolvase
MLEKELQKQVTNALADKGYYVVKLIQTNRNGIPDLLAVKENRCIFIELKRGNGTARKLQEYRMNEIRSHGVECYLLNEVNKTEILSLT